MQCIQWSAITPKKSEGEKKMSEMFIEVFCDCENCRHAKWRRIYWEPPEDDFDCIYDGEEHPDHFSFDWTDNPEDTICPYFSEFSDEEKLED